MNGRPDLQGPIANFFVARDGQIFLVGDGIANNAGTGNARVCGHSDWTGNARTVGIEWANNGTGEAPTAPGWTAYTRLVAAISEELAALNGRTVTEQQKYVLGHKEWSTTGKIDPTFDMSTFRNAVRNVDLNEQQHKPTIVLEPDDVFVYNYNNAGPVAVIPAPGRYVLPMASTKADDPYGLNVRKQIIGALTNRTPQGEPVFWEATDWMNCTVQPGAWSAQGTLLPPASRT